MANVTSKCTITGGNLAVDRPFGWHVWQVYVPAATLTQAQADTIYMPDHFPSGTYMLDTRLLLLANAGASSGNYTVVVTSNEYTISTAAYANAATLLSVTDIGETTGTLFAAAVATPLTTYTDMYSIDAATLRGAIGLTITPASTFTDGALTLAVAVLMGRVNY